MSRPQRRRTGRRRSSGLGSFEAAPTWSGELLNNAIVALDFYAPSGPTRELATDWLEMWGSSWRSLRQATPFLWQATLSGFWERYRNIYNALPLQTRLNPKIAYPEAVQPNDILREQWARLRDQSGADQAAAWVAKQAAAAKQAVEEKLQASVESLTSPAMTKLAAERAAAEKAAKELVDRLLLGAGALVLLAGFMLRRRRLQG